MITYLLLKLEKLVQISKIILFVSYPVNSSKKKAIQKQFSSRFNLSKSATKNQSYLSSRFSGTKNAHTSGKKLNEQPNLFFAESLRASSSCRRRDVNVPLTPPPPTAVLKCAAAIGDGNNGASSSSNHGKRSSRSPSQVKSLIRLSTVWFTWKSTVWSRQAHRLLNYIQGV